MASRAARKALSHRFASKGGSRKTASIEPGAEEASTLKAFVRRTSTASACSFAFVARSSSTSSGSCSTSSTLAAPREAASKPSAPVPANASMQRQPSRSWPSQLNSVSRTRSGVGLRPGLSRTGSFVRFHCPPMMRTSRGGAALLVMRPSLSARQKKAGRPGGTPGTLFSGGKIQHPCERRSCDSDGTHCGKSCNSRVADPCQH